MSAIFGGRDRLLGSIPSLTATGVFDPLWYRETYPDAMDRHGSPEAHFKAEGAWRGDRPNRFFDTPRYLTQHPDLRRSGLDPLTHYLVRGEREGATPNPDFDPAWYAETYPAHRANAWGAFAHYCATGSGRGLSTRPGQVSEIEQVVCEMRAANLFDPNLYRILNPDVARAGVDPLMHYVADGAREGRQPHPLFDVGFYLDQVPDRTERDSNVIWHYARFGSSLDLDPDTWFDSAWYRARYAHLMLPHDTPVSHYIRFGGYRTHPSPLFDAIRYRRDCAEPLRDVDPVSHFMLRGMDRGQPVHAVAGEGVESRRAAAAALIRVKRPASVGRKTALLVTFAAGGRIKGHVPAYVDGLARGGLDVVLIVAAPERTTVIPKSLVDACSAVYVRENAGFDFAAWAHVLVEDPELLRSETLFLTNDSIVGPLGDDAFGTLLDRIDAADEPVVGLTDNRFYAWHLQSFFLAVKSECLTSEAFRDFIGGVLNLSNKDAVIRAYELTLTGRLIAAGFPARALFPMESRNTFEGNRSVLGWQRLLDDGFPFVKASLVIGEHRQNSETAVRSALREWGFDLSRFDPGFVHPGPSIDASFDRWPVTSGAA